MPTLLEAYTVADYELWEGDWELIQGQPLAMTPSPGIRHQQVAMGLARQLDEGLEDCPACQVLYEVDVQLAEDTVVRPDLVVFCFPAEGDRLLQPPELVVEVVSPARARRDEVIKLGLYREAGVRDYILVYPEEEKVWIHRWSGQAYGDAEDVATGLWGFDLSHCRVELDFDRLWRRSPG
jgi:Uma2 family endonuclease